MEPSLARSPDGPGPDLLRASSLTATSQVPLTPPLIPRHLRPPRSPAGITIFCPKPDPRLSRLTGNDIAISFAEAGT